MKQVRIINKSKATVAGERIAVANSFLTRLIGLMGCTSLSPGEGMLITPSSGVHTCWMRMKIDVVALDRKKRVVRLGHEVKPWRLCGLTLRTAHVLELPPGQIRACGIEIGDELEIEQQS
jgi:uncharacterized membrane protein (UPF0127 family)